MKKNLHYYLLVFSFLGLVTSCSKDTFDEYYARPENLEPPIFQQLEARGNFKNLTALIEKAGYKDILGKAGYWTMIAPNDAAFTKYFQEQGISDISKVDDATAGKIVRYALIYNAFRTERMSDYQSATGWVPDNAFRRRTAYYDGFVTKTVNGQTGVTVGSNRNGLIYFPDDNNNKYVSYFTTEYFTARGLSSYDFNYFYPNAKYSGFNVLDSNVTTADIVAENGIIHEVDKVNLPLINLDQYLEEKPQYSVFRKILEDNLVTYYFSPGATTNYHNFTGKSDNVYVKGFDPGLSFAPNNENFLKQADNDGQSDLYTMIVPENAPLQEFIDKVLLKNFSDLGKLPKYVFQDLINAHMVKSAVWPSKAASSNNGLNEDLRFDFNSSDIKEAKILSNGFFYGATKVQKSNLFYSVYTSAYLHPQYTLATRLFNDGSGIKQMISNIYSRYTVFLPSDAVLRAAGFEWDPTHTQWTYTPPGGTAVAGGVARTNLLRVLYNGVIRTPKNELNNLSGSGIIRSGDLDLPGEYIKWDNNKVYAAGNEAKGTAVNIIGFEDQQNGRAYYVDNVLMYSEDPQGKKIEQLSATPGSQFLSFFNYLKNSAIYTATTGVIQGVDPGTSYTFIIPNNAAIAAAVTAGALPTSNNPTAQNEKDMVADFIRYHILVNKIASDDGLTTGQFETLKKDGFGEKTYAQVFSTPGTLYFQDLKLRKANYIPAQSNNLADRSLIHLVDNYLLHAE